MRFAATIFLLLMTVTLSARKGDRPGARADGGQVVAAGDIFDRHGYSVWLSASALAGRTADGNVKNMSLHLSNGYLFRNGLSLGLGTGLEELDVPVMPLYADLRYHPLKSRISPYVWVKGGWALTFIDNSECSYFYFPGYTRSRGGPMLNAGAGIELASWRRNAVNIGIGYRYQKITFLTEGRLGDQSARELDSFFNRAEVQLGFTFR